jgi:hypothetical protein
VKAGAQKGGVVRRVPVYEHAVEIPGVPNPLRLRGEYERGWGGTGGVEKIREEEHHECLEGTKRNTAD